MKVTQHGFNRTVEHESGPARGLAFTRVWSNTQFDRALFDEREVEYQVNPDCETLLEAPIGSAIHWCEPVDSGMDAYLIQTSLIALGYWLDKEEVI